MNDFGPKAVMGVFKAFGAERRPVKVRLTKIGSVVGRTLKITHGQIVEGNLISEVNVGLSFNIINALITEGNSPVKNISQGDRFDFYCTSIIQKILSNNTFQTKNSIYKWEII